MGRLKPAPTSPSTRFARSGQAHSSSFARIVSRSFAASGIIFVTSSMFHAMGNTMPSLISSFTRLVVSIPMLLLADAPGFQLWWVWYISVGTVALQLALNLLLLRREFRVRLSFAGPVPV
jgi:Na+-driven multidrug efflux pump